MADINALLAQGVSLPQIESPVNQFARLQALRSAQQEQQLNALKLQEAQTTMGQQEALRNYLAGATDYTSPEFTTGLTKFGAPGLAVAKGLSEQATAELTRKKTQSELTKAQSELVASKTAQARQMLEGIDPNDPNAPAQYNQWLEAVHKDEVLGPTFDNFGATLESSKARLQAALAQPGGFANLLNESKLGAEKFATIYQKQTAETEPKMGTYQPGDYTTASWAKFMQTKKPEDLKLKPTATEQKAAVEANLPDLTPKEIQKREAVYPKASASYRAANQEIDSLITDLKTLRDHSGLEGITGVIKGRTPGVTPQARAAEALLEKIQSRGQFRTLQEMRMNSPTGGALGNVSDFEGRSLRSSFGALDRRQATEDFQKQIDNTISDLQNSKQNIAQAYEDTYSYKQGNAPAAGASPAGGAPAAGKTSKGATTSNW